MGLFVSNCFYLKRFFYKHWVLNFQLFYSQYSEQISYFYCPANPYFPSKIKSQMILWWKKWCCGGREWFFTTLISPSSPSPQFHLPLGSDQVSWKSIMLGSLCFFPKRATYIPTIKFQQKMTNIIDINAFTLFYNE